MFTNIPVHKTVDIMYEILVKSGQTLDAADELEKLILHCVKDNIDLHYYNVIKSYNRMYSRLFYGRAVATVMVKQKKKKKKCYSPTSNLNE